MWVAAPRLWNLTETLCWELRTQHGDEVGSSVCAFDSQNMIEKNLPYRRDFALYEIITVWPGCSHDTVACYLQFLILALLSSWPMIPPHAEPSLLVHWHLFQLTFC